MNLNIDKNSILYQIDKKIAENNLKIPFFQAIIESVEKVKHHKNITIAIEKQCTKKIYLSKQYNSFTVKFYFENTVYHNSSPDKNGISTADHFNNNGDDIWFSDYQELKKNCQERISSIEENIVKLLTEKNNIDIFIKQAEELEKLYKTFDDTYSYTLKQAIHF